MRGLTVRLLPSGYYQIIAGERRWRASRKAGLTEVPAVIIEADDRKATELALTVYGFHGAKQRGLFVQRIAVIGEEAGGDVQAPVLYKGAGAGVPGGVASGLKGGPQAAGGERGCVGLTPHQPLAQSNLEWPF